MVADRIYTGPRRGADRAPRGSGADDGPDGERRRSHPQDAASEQLRQELGTADTPGETSRIVTDALVRSKPTRAEMEAYYHGHPEIFQTRSFAESAVNIGILLQVEGARRELGLPPGRVTTPR
jgi:hypothetical protein